MSFRFFRGPLIGLLLCLLPAALRAADAPAGPSPAEAKLRESVRALTLQLRAADSEKGALQAAKDEAEAKLAAQTEEIEKLKKSVETEQNETKIALAAAETKRVETEAKLMAKEKSVEAWKKAHGDVTTQFNKVVEIGNAKETERAKLAARVIVLDRQVFDQRAKNAAMHKLGTEILSRYEKFGLGDVITRKEPFIGTTRVKFDTLIQDFSDGLADQKIKP